MAASGLAHPLLLSTIFHMDQITVAGMTIETKYVFFTWLGMAILLVAGIVLRKNISLVPGKFQLVIEKIVEFFDGLAKNNSPHSNGFLGCYIFSAGCYICIGTLFELLGVQWTATNGATVSLPAPLSDINAAIAMGCMSYLVILGGGIIKSGGRGLGKALKEFSLPISMSFRLFGALLSGLLVTELVYYYIALSVVLPVIVGVLFTLLHALIQTYVLVVLTATYFGEVTEPHAVNPDKKKKKRRAAAQAA